jgi:molybdate transport system substrate-binding protein
MSYRRAWLLVQSINEAAGEPLVEAAVGGTRGGGARLTPRGQIAMTTFRTLQRTVIHTAGSALQQLLAGPATESIHVVAAASLEEVLGQLLADYALQQPAVRVRAVYGGSDELADHLLSGAAGDLFLTADEEQLNRLQQSGLTTPGGRVPLADNTLAIIGPADSLASLKKPKDLLGQDISRVAMAQSSCPLGKYTQDCLTSLGIYHNLQERGILVDNSRAVLAVVRAGQADAGLVYGSDTTTASGCRVLYRFRRTEKPIRYWAGIIGQHDKDDRVPSLLQFLTSTQAARRFRQCGFAPSTHR